MNNEREPWKSRGLRVFLVDNYLVFYIPDRERQMVTVIRVMYPELIYEIKAKEKTIKELEERIYTLETKYLRSLIICCKKCHKLLY